MALENGGLRAGGLLVDGLVTPITPLGDYQFYVDEGSGDTLNNELGSGTASISTSATWTSTTAGVGGYVLTFASDERATTDFQVTYDKITVCNWCKLSNPGVCVEIGNYSGEESASFEQKTSDTYDFLVSDGSGTTQGIVNGNTSQTTGNWMFTAITFDDTRANEFEIFIYGKNSLVGNDTAGTSLFNTGMQNVSIGKESSNARDTAPGDYDFWAIAENTVLTQTDIETLRDDTIAGK